MPATVQFDPFDSSMNRMRNLIIPLALTRKQWPAPAAEIALHRIRFERNLCRLEHGPQQYSDPMQAARKTNSDASRIRAERRWHPTVASPARYSLRPPSLTHPPRSHPMATSFLKCNSPLTHVVRKLPHCGIPCQEKNLVL